MIVQWVEEAVLREIEEVQNIEVEVVWEPAWNISMADDNVKRQLSGL
jgi:metal-sulfur cluster biosynthetic enzyme